MKREYRLYGMMICLIIAFVSLAFLSFPVFHTLSKMMIMFVAGYGLRETLDEIGDKTE